MNKILDDPCNLCLNKVKNDTAKNGFYVCENVSGLRLWHFGKSCLELNILARLEKNYTYSVKNLT